MPFFFIVKHSRAPKRSWKIFHGGPGKVLDFFVSKRVGTVDNGLSVSDLQDSVVIISNYADQQRSRRW